MCGSIFKRIKTIKRTYEVDDKIITLAMVSKLKGNALQWYYSKPEYAALLWTELETHMLNMYATQEDRIVLMRKFEARKWKRNEPFQTYFHEKVLLGNRLKLDEKDIISYIIDGIDNYVLRCQAKMKEFTSLNKLLIVMGEVVGSSGEHANSRNEPTQTTTKQSSPMVPGRRHSKCFNCSAEDHVIANCPKPKRPRDSCFICGQLGHYANACPSKQSRNPTRPGQQRQPQSAEQRQSEPSPHQGSTRQSTYLLYAESEMAAPPKMEDVRVSSTNQQAETIDSDRNENIVDIGRNVPNSRYFVQVKMDKYPFDAIIDNSSPISLINGDYIIKRHILPHDKCQLYTGINGSPLEILGLYRDVIKIENCEIKFEFIVVSSKTMSFSCLLGRDFICNPNIVVTFSDSLYSES